MPSLLVGVLLVAVVAAPTMQTACDENSGSRSDIFDVAPDTGEVFAASDGVRFRAQVIATGWRFPGRWPSPKTADSS